MTWNLDGGEVILRLRLAKLSGVWDEVYREYLNNQPLPSVPIFRVRIDEEGENG
jgi:hypothetical protein